MIFSQRASDPLHRLEQVGALLGEAGIGPISQIVMDGVEDVLFGGCIAGATHPG